MRYPSLLKLLPIALSTCLLGCNDSNQFESSTANIQESSVPIQVEIYLNSVQQVSDVESDATGFAELNLDPDTGVLSGVLQLEGVTASAAHLHQGFAGEKGAVVAAFTAGELAGQMVLPVTTMDQAQQAMLLDGGFYINVHSEAFPEGEIRGQITPEGISVRMASLQGGQLTPPRVTPGSASGYVTVNDNDNRITAHLLTSHLEQLTDVELYTGGIGESAEKVASLLANEAQVESLSLHWQEVPQLTVDALLEQQSYLLARTERLPEGALRGQLLSPRASLYSFALDSLQLSEPYSSSETGVGSGSLLLDHTDGELTIKVVLPETAGVDKVELHQGGIGESGQMLLPLNADAEQSGHFSLTTTLSEQELSALKQGGWYLLASSVEESLMRGQVMPTPSQTGFWLDPRSMLSDQQEFSIFWDGQPLGQAVIQREVSQDSIKITEITDAVPFGVVETLSVTLDKATAAPLHYTGTGTSGERSIDIELDWMANQLSGHSDLTNQPLSRLLPGSSLEQLGLFYALHSFPLNEGLSVPVTVYNALEDSIAERTLHVTGIEQVSVAAGSFETFRVLLDGAEVNQIFYITTEVPRKLVKIGFDAFPITYELQ